MELKTSFYEQHKDKIIKKVKQYRDTHKDEIKEKKKRYYEENKDKIRERRQTLYENNKEQIQEQRKQYYKEHPEKLIEGNLTRIKRKYNLSDVQVKYLKEMKNCKICRNPFDNNRIKVVDHNHTTGDFRGVICKYCNITLGTAFDNIETLENCAKYLKGELFD